MIGLKIYSDLGQDIDSGFEWFGDDCDHYTKYEVTHRIYSNIDALPLSPLYLSYIKNLLSVSEHTEWADHGRYGELSPGEIVLSDRTVSVVNQLNTLLGEELFVSGIQCNIDITDYINKNGIIELNNKSVLELVETHVWYPNEVFPFCYRYSFQCGETPLGYAIRMKNSELFHSLIKQGAVIIRSVVDNYGSLDYFFAYRNDVIFNSLMFALDSSDTSMKDYYIVKRMNLSENSLIPDNLIIGEYVSAIKFGYKKIVLKLFVKYNRQIVKSIKANNNPYIEDVSPKDSKMKILIEDYIGMIYDKEMTDSIRKEIDEKIKHIGWESPDGWIFCS